MMDEILVIKESAKHTIVYVPSRTMTEEEIEAMRQEQEEFYGVGCYVALMPTFVR